MSSPKSSHEKWWRGFKTRYPKVIYRNPESLSDARMNLSETVIRQWFSDIKAYLSEKEMQDILEDPKRCFNFDETNVLMTPKSGKVLGISGIKHCYEAASGKEKQGITVFSIVGKFFLSWDSILNYQSQFNPK